MSDHTSHPRRPGPRTTGALSTLALALAFAAFALLAVAVTGNAQPQDDGQIHAGVCRSGHCGQPKPADKCSETGSLRDCYHGVAYAGVYIGVVIYVLVGGSPAGHLDPHGSIGWNGSMTR